MLRIEIGLYDAHGNKHEITLDAETIDDYNVCKKLLRELWHEEIIGNYGVVLVNERSCACI